ncbi:MAG TPA: AMP-binding protein, partial [Candidatus Acidoferrum sp.]|nr:AMP-binding protein [Candidatus Acidoferrum sp.]
MKRGNLISLLESAGKFARDAAVVERQGYRRKSRTYAELRAAAGNSDARLAARGVGPGDRVVLWGANSAAWIASFWGLMLRGAVAVPMDAGATREFVERATRESGAKLVLRDPDLPAPECGVPSEVLDDLRHDRAGRPESAAGGASRAGIAEILFTSGTTAEPRGVVLTHGNFLANLEPIEQAIGPYRKYERWLHPLKFVSLVPLSHVFGQFLGLFVPPLVGAAVVFENSANPADILRTVERERATVLVAVPRMLDLVRSQIEREIDGRGWRKWFERTYEAAAGRTFLERAWRFRRIHRLFGIRFWAFICGGAALGAETEQFFKRLGFAVVQGYGMTETASLVSLNHPFRAAEGSVGKILPGRECKLAEDGEILVRGENVSAGYWEKGQLRAASDGGWLRTGDLGELDADGNLRFRGRKKNVIVTAAGLNVYPEDLEQALKRQPAIRDAVVISLESNGNAEPWAVLLPQAGAAGEGVEAAVAAANSTLAEYQRIRNWSLWPEPDFPRTPSGKPQQQAIAVRARNSGAKSAGLETGSLAAATSGFESLSSLDRVELLSALEQRYNVEINEEEFSEAKTAGELRTLLAASAARGGGEGSKAGARYHYPRWTQLAPVRWLRLVV